MWQHFQLFNMLHNSHMGGTSQDGEKLLKKFLPSMYWVIPSKRGGMDGVFRGLAGLLRGIS